MVIAVADEDGQNSWYWLAEAEGTSEVHHPWEKEGCSCRKGNCMVPSQQSRDQPERDAGLQKLFFAY